jgi:hypothetical protein
MKFWVRSEYVVETEGPGVRRMPEEVYVRESDGSFLLARDGGPPTKEQE